MITGIKKMGKKISLIRKLRRTAIRLTPPTDHGDYNKVFCLGWIKTGTTSFGNAMRRLGFKHCGWSQDAWRKWYQKGEIDKIIEYARHFESFDDLPWSQIDLLERFDQEFPRSKFVLLERDLEIWFKSYYNFHIREGDVPLSKEEALKKYEERIQFIKQYFSGTKKKQLLIMDITQGDGYDILCPFLQVPVLKEPFPHSNRTPPKHKKL